MTKLIKDFTVNVIPGTAGVPGVPGVPARPGYWVSTVRYVQQSSIINAPITTTGQETPAISLAAGQNIRICTQAETWLISSVRPFMNEYWDCLESGLDQYTDPLSSQYIYFHRVKEALQNEWYRILSAEQAFGFLGNPLRLLYPPAYPTDSYIAAWDDGGIWFYMFTGFSPTERPHQTVVARS